jgi:DNA invertase Pin-like site-specific DNA recombinase
MLIGYARVSTADQNLSLQRDALKAAGCDRVFEDKVSGSRAERVGLHQAMDMLRPGDTLVGWKLDRLGRSVGKLVETVEKLEKQGIDFKSLTDEIDTRSPSGRFFFHVMASLAQMERELIAECRVTRSLSRLTH